MFVRKTIMLVALAAGALFAGAAPALSLQTRNVAVSRVTPTSAVLVVKADVPANVDIDYGSAPGSYSASKNSAGQVRHEIVLDGLAPSSTVYYRATIIDGANPALNITLPEKSFHTARSDGQPFSFAVAADNRPGSNTTVQPAVWSTIVGQMVAGNPDLTLHVGDIIFGLGTDTLAQNVAKYDGFFAVTSQMTASVPMYTAIGNHEVVNAVNSRAGYEQEFTLPVNNGADATTYGEHYYSFDYGDTHFIALSTEIPGQQGLITGNQKAWLQQDLVSTSKPWIVVWLHRPLFSGVHLTDPWMDINNVTGQQNKTDIHNLFRQYGVDLVFSGHEHYYLRHVEDGIHYVITGGAGSPLYAVPALGAGDVYAVSTYEHVKVDETADSLKVSAINSSGATLEYFTLGVPTMALSHLRTFWASYAAYLARELSVDYSLANNGPGDAENVQAVYLTASNGVSPQTVTPFGFDDLKNGQNVSFTVNYLVPQGVAVFRAATYVTCNDLAGSLYAFPGPAPVY